MIAIFLAPFYLLLCYYVLRWTLKWMGGCVKLFQSRAFHVLFLLLYSFMALTPLTGFLIKAEPFHRFFKVASNIWFGIFLYTLLGIACADLVRIIVKRRRLLKKEVYESRKVLVISGMVTTIVISALSIHGFLHARHLYTTTYEVSLEKTCENRDSLKIALAADLHLGYSIGEWHMRQMVDRINAMEPDLVVFAGDIFDNEFESIKNPEKIQQILSTLKSTYGSYACYGNHDLDEPILAGFTFGSGKKQTDDSRMERFFEEAGITLLNDESVLIDDSFYLIGRKDASRSKKAEDGRAAPSELTNDLDHAKPVIVIDHQPKEYQELADCGVDLDLSGHTHNGQIFPGNLFIGFMWDNACGYLKKDNMHTIVTSGVGVWGPNMRVGTKSEVVEIQVNFGETG